MSQHGLGVFGDFSVSCVDERKQSYTVLRHARYLVAKFGRAFAADVNTGVITVKMRFALGACLLLGTAAPSFAQDGDSNIPPSTAGAHVAVVTGYDTTKFSGGGSSDTLDGVNYGVKLGYDFNVVQYGMLGVEAEATDSTAKLDAGGGDSVKMGRDLYIGGRLKFDVSNAIAIYMKAGYTNAEIKATSAGLTAKTTVDGWRLGAGAEFNLTRKLFGLIEYRYSNYGSYDVGIGTPVKLERHQGIAGIGYRF